MKIMSHPLTPEEIERIARRRASAKLGWYVHATVYLLVNVALFAASSQGFGQRHWSSAPALGWGLGLVLHGLAVFVLGTGSRVREGLVQRERERLLREQQRP